MLSRCPALRYPKLKERLNICNTASTPYLFKLQSIHCIYIVSHLGWELGLQEGGFTQYLLRLISSPLPNSRSYPHSQAREIRSQKSLKLLFMLNYRFQVPDTSLSLIMLLTPMPLGQAGTLCARSSIATFTRV